MRREFIGGRVPKMVKDAFVAEADQAGLTLTEHLEKILTERMNGKAKEESSPPVSLESIREIIREELFEEEEEEEIYSEEEPDEDYIDTDRIDDLLESPMGQYINYALWTTWWQNKEEWSEEEISDEGIVDFLEKTSAELQFLVEVPETLIEETEPYPDFLPEQLIPIIDDLLGQMEIPLEDQSSVNEALSELASQMDHTADILFQDSRAIEFMFTRQEYFQLDKMLDKINNSRWTDQHFKNLKSLILYELAEKLEESGTGFWGVTDEDMVELGKRWKMVAAKP
jgi:hypothetical protein